MLRLSSLISSLVSVSVLYADLFKEDAPVLSHQCYLSNGAQCLLVVHVFFSGLFVDGSDSCHSGAGCHDDDFLAVVYQFSALSGQVSKNSSSSCRVHR